MLDLLALADRMRVAVRYSRQLDRWGRYDHRDRTITLVEGLGAVQWRCTLAHELGHAHFGHEMTCPKTERHADEWAVKLLVPPHAWVEATSSADTLSCVAQELGVTPRLAVIAHKMYSDLGECATA